MKYYLQAAHKVQARSLVWFWAMRELGMSMVQLSKRLKTSRPTVSQSGTRSEKNVKENKLRLLQNKYQLIKAVP